MSERVQTDVFLTHDWGKDEMGRGNHDRVARVNVALQKLGYITWFDSEQMTGNIVKKMAEGIENTRLVLVFVTQRYQDKVGGNNEGDNCMMEFNYALRSKTKAFMISIVMEKSMSNPLKWTGPVGLGLGGELAVRMYFDFSDEAKFTAAMAELKKEIDVRLKKLQAGVPESSAATTAVQLPPVPPRNTEISRTTTVWDEKEWDELRDSCKTLKDITSRVEGKRINNMFVVVDLLMDVTRLNPPTTEDAEVFVNRLDNMSQDNHFKKISRQHIDSIIAALKLSPRQEKVQFIALLEKIKTNPTFSSCHDNVILSVPGDKVITTGNVCKIPFEFKHPGTPAECHMSGKCGFIIKCSKQGEYWKWELCTQDTEYNDTGLHLHEIVSTEDMHYYVIVSGITQEGNTVLLPYSVGRRRWLPNVSNWKLVQFCVSYNVSSYLVAKQD